MHFIILLRHGESEGNLNGILQGQSDTPLSTEGREQATKLTEFWKSAGVRFDLIICSPLSRAAQTAEIISSGLLCPVELESDWKERHYGQLQGLLIKEIEQRSPKVDFFHPYNPIGGNGESQLDLFIRASRALQKIIRKPAGSYLVVSHGGILNKAMYVIMGLTPQGHYNSPVFHFENTGYAQLRYNSETRQWAVISLNSYSPHLEAQGAKAWSHD